MCHLLLFKLRFDYNKWFLLFLVIKMVAEKLNDRSRSKKPNII